MIIYTDGSYREKESCICAFICLQDNIIKYQYKYTKKYKDKWEVYRVNNSTYAELMAIEKAVKFVIDKKEKAVIYTDVDSVVNIIENNLCRNSYLCSFQKFMRKYKDYYEIRWCKGHSNNKYNAYVDKMCRDIDGLMNNGIEKVDLVI